MENAGSALLGGYYIIVLGIGIFAIVAMWKVFAKAGRPGWGAIIPIYNTVLLCQIGGKPGWWVLLLLVPVLDIIIAIIVSLGVAEHFGKGTGFGLGLAFLGPVFYAILAFGSSEYTDY